MSQPASASHTGSDFEAAIFDMDGTLVDSNFHHVIAWHRAFQAYDVTVPLWRVSRHMGMGGDKLVTAVAGEKVERVHGEDLRKAWKAHFGDLLPEVTVLAGASDLLHAVADRGVTVVLASSGEAHHVEHFIDLLSVRDVAAGWTTSADVENTKPEPDLFEVALRKAGGGSAITFGDSTWDCEAAGRLGLPTVALRTGGFGLDELRAAGAREVYDSLEDIASALDTVLRR